MLRIEVRDFMGDLAPDFDLMVLAAATGSAGLRSALPFIGDLGFAFAAFFMLSLIGEVSLFPFFMLLFNFIGDFFTPVFMGDFLGEGGGIAKVDG